MPTGLLGGLLAASIAVSCTVVNFDPVPTLVCDDRERTQLAIPYADWPQQWHGPELGFAYQVDAEFRPVQSQADAGKMAEAQRRSRNEQLRWMREALQNPRKGRQ